MNIQKIIESLSPHEKKILPYLKENIDEICEKTGLDNISVLRALEYLQNKGLAELKFEKKRVVEIGINGSLYRSRGLPERRLLNLLDKKHILPLSEAQKESKLSDDEFKASLGALKKKALIELRNEKIIFNANKEEISRKSPEEALIEALPLDYDSLSPEQLYALKALQNRKDIIQTKEVKTPNFKITETGKKILESGIKGPELIEQLTPETLKKDSLWKGKRFRRYDILSPLPAISGGKRHFVNQSVDYARKIWTEMGFKEMSGDLIVSSFWNFDALFTAQDHSVRDMQDTFFIDKKAELPGSGTQSQASSSKERERNKKLVKAVKKAHEKGVAGSRGWEYDWNSEEAKKLVLRTHTTCLSSQKLMTLKETELPAKFFALGKCFRNETVDWSHGFEFNQTEGIVVDKDANFKHLLGYLKQFFNKMGFEKVRMRPAYFPYTEPSVEIDVWHPEKKVWLELGGAGIFRPEVTVPLLGKNIPVLAWGPGFDRILMDYYEIKDLRELYKNDLTKLRKMKFWVK